MWIKIKKTTATKKKTLFGTTSGKIEKRQGQTFCIFETQQFVDLVQAMSDFDSDVLIKVTMIMYLHEAFHFAKNWGVTLKV